MVGTKNLSDDERNIIVQWLLQNSKDGKPKRGKMQEAQVRFNRLPRTITRLWAAAKEQLTNGQVLHLKSRKPNAPRRKRVIIDLELIESLELQKKSTIRGLANGIHCCPTTVWRWVNKGWIKSHTSALKPHLNTSALKPHLTTPNKLSRLRFSMEAIEFDMILNTLRFKSMHSTVHIDEKWFYITRTSHRYYLTPGEVEPHRTCKNKRFITKVMFMCAVCRPIFDANGFVVFDGKIGIFPFTQLVAAQRTSRNRPTDTLETKLIPSITKDVIKECLINQVLPAIRSKWPSCASRLIFIQQDNAPPHVKDTDLDFRAAATLDGFDIHLVHQPPNSPDSNVNDLGWFRAIQSLQVQKGTKTVEELVDAVLTSFVELSPITLNKVFLTLQGCMLEIMRVKGQNCYKRPHMSKDALLRQDALPKNLEVSVILVRECIDYLIQNGLIAKTENLQCRLGLIIDDWTLDR